MIKNKISVVIPVYNQVKQIKVILQRFSHQDLQENLFEIILVDDGSTDQFAEYDAKQLKMIYGIKHLELLHCEKGGRSAARNKGIEASSGDSIVFCDGDRIPSKFYLSKYLEDSICREVNIGNPMDYFGAVSEILNTDDKNLEVLSRSPQYYKKVCEALFDGNGKSISEWSWLGLLIGNSCIRRDVFKTVGKFSLEFSDWGFEHFELGYRIMQAGYPIYVNNKINSYHMVHKRSSGFYEKNIRDSIQLMHKMYNVNELLLGKIFLDEKNKYNFNLLKEGVL